MERPISDLCNHHGEMSPKLNFSTERTGKGGSHMAANVVGALLYCLLFLGMAGCATVAPLPQVNLKEPGWTVREGQAVWRRKQGAPELAGDILVATRNDGRALVQFSKTPLPLVIAQSTPNSWEVESPVENKRYSGRGQPPARLIFLYLPKMLTGQPPPRGWSWHSLENHGWHLENSATGESLEGYFSQ
ncbi:MAG: hypothetical protein JWR26_4405 [Pedosphaera sp.]|nr:hypothetical protein [Pedosphaera sp.]